VITDILVQLVSEFLSYWKQYVGGNPTMISTSNASNSNNNKSSSNNNPITMEDTLLSEEESEHTHSNLYTRLVLCSERLQTILWVYCISFVVKTVCLEILFLRLSMMYLNVD